MQQLKLGLIGLQFGGYLARQEIVGGPGAPFLKVAAVCDQVEQRAHEHAKEFAARSYLDAAVLCADQDLDVVGIFTGPARRADLIRMAIRAGKHVITTKPLELDPDAALDVLHEARDLGRVVHLNSPGPRISADLAQILRWHEQYQLGKPIGARGDAWHSGAFEETADGSWYDDPALCPGAPLFRIGIYLINDLMQLFGTPVAVQSLQSRLVTGRPTPDTAQLGMRFASGALATIFASMAVADGDPYEAALTLNYERGTIYRNVGPGRNPMHNGAGPITLALRATAPDGSPISEQLELAQDSGAYQWEAFYRAVVAGERENEVSPETVVTGLRVIRAMARSLQSGQTEMVEHDRSLV